MRNELTLADFRDEVKSLLAATVQEVFFDSDEPSHLWKLHAGLSNIDCEIECSGNWFVTLDDWYVTELRPVGETRLAAFVASLDVAPLELVTARINSKIVGSWLRFADGLEFEDLTVPDRLTTRRRGYSVEVTPWVAGCVRLDLLPG